MTTTYDRAEWMPESREPRHSLRWKGTNPYYQALKSERYTKYRTLSETEVLGLIERLPTPTEIRKRIMYGY